MPPSRCGLAQRRRYIHQQDKRTNGVPLRKRQVGIGNNTGLYRGMEDDLGYTDFDPGSNLGRYLEIASIDADLSSDTS